MTSGGDGPAGERGALPPRKNGCAAAVDSSTASSLSGSSCPSSLASSAAPSASASPALRSWSGLKKVQVSSLNRPAPGELSRILHAVWPLLCGASPPPAKPELADFPGITFALNLQNAYEINTALGSKASVIHLFGECGPLRRHVAHARRALHYYQMQGIFSAIWVILACTGLRGASGSRVLGRRLHALLLLSATAGVTSAVHALVRYCVIGRRGFWRALDYAVVEVPLREEGEEIPRRPSVSSYGSRASAPSKADTDTFMIRKRGLLETRKSAGGAGAGTSDAPAPLRRVVPAVAGRWILRSLTAIALACFGSLVGSFGPLALR